MDISGRLLNEVFDKLPRGSNIDLVIDTTEAREAVKMCADIIVQGWDNTYYCQLESWRRLMGTWKRQGSSMSVREFEEEGDDSDCAGLGLAASREAWQTEKDAVEMWNDPANAGE
jgi:hypothetical protein